LRHSFALFAVLSAAIPASAADAQQATAPGDVPRAHYITVQDGEFRKMDADKNGQVTRAEVEAFQRLAAVATAQARNRQLFAQLDANRDGQISLVQHRAGKLASFDRLDTDKDGVVTVAEMRPAGVSAPTRLSKFDRGALRGFYTQRENNRSARQQAENIAREIEKGAGDEPEAR
jgi:Ca2+-binding EF-hand superfamily protein